VNVTDLRLSSVQFKSFSTSHKCFTPLFCILFILKSSIPRCDGFDFRAEVRMRHCFSVILHPHRLKAEREIDQICVKFVCIKSHYYSSKIMENVYDHKPKQGTLRILFTIEVIHIQTH